MPRSTSFCTHTIPQAIPNTETTLIADVDVDLIKELHSFGAARNLQDRRTDIYKIVSKGRVQDLI